MTMTITMTMTMSMRNENYKLTEKNYFLLACVKMSCYWFNRQEILQNAKERYSKEKAAEYYSQNKETIKEKSREHY